MKTILTALLLIVATCACAGEALSVIPRPLSMAEGVGGFTIDSETRVTTDPENAELVAIATYLGGLVNAERSSDTGAIVLEIVAEPDTLGAEGYLLDVTPDRILLRANEAEGIFRGVQTLRQLHHGDGFVPAVSIVDRPRFRWRGLLLDCCRHFMTKDFVKRYIDLLAYHKMNTLHWHLTEDQGWRIEIEKYPRLTEVGAWRDDGAGGRYGGYYTQDDIREVVAYAASRYITVVPEIEMPGHSVAALAAYPELSCAGGPFEVETQWGVHQDVYCAGNERTFAFLEDVLTEVMALFPSEYIHIGGDECPKARWAECSKCRARIDDEGLADEHELQSWFIRRMEGFLAGKGRRLIGWDEILEGGLAPGATVQSWRGMDGGIAAARAGHDVIMSPTSHAYFDYDVGTTDLRQVYSFEPVPPELTEEEARHILGGECNMWTERAPQETIDGKVFPRILAMCEVLWSPPAGRDFDEFYGRVRRHYDRLDALGVDYGPEARPISIRAGFDANLGASRVAFEAGEPGLDVRYTLDASTPRIDSAEPTGEVILDRTVTVKGQAFRDGCVYGETDSVRYVHHAAIGRVPAMAAPCSPRYTAGGETGLVDGILGSGNFRDGHWQGFESVDVEAVIDLGNTVPLEAVEVRFLRNTGSWIFLPTALRLLASYDGEHFLTVGEMRLPEARPEAGIEIRTLRFDLAGGTPRHLKLQAESITTCPGWHPGNGGKAWLFIDEIIVTPAAQP